MNPATATAPTDPRRLPPDLLWRCRPDRFAAHVTRHKRPDLRFQRYRHIVYLAERVAMAIIAGRGRLIVNLPPQHGKALAVDTPIPTPSGWTAIGDLQPGDEVFDETGRPTRVVAVSPVWKGRRSIPVSTDSGDTIVADAKHEWMVSLCRKRRGHVTRHETGWLAARTSPRAPLVNRCPGLQLPEREDLPVHPYVLGLWLGDGTSTAGDITAGDLDREWLREEIAACGYDTTRRRDPRIICVRGLKVALRGAGLLSQKHVPPAYLRASAGQRRAILQGLIDSDGHVAPDGQVEFCSTNRRLADGVQELAASLGYKASIHIGRAVLRGRDCGPKYRVMFYGADVARLPRKRERCRDAASKPHHYLTFGDEQLADTVCIEVEAESHLFLAGRSMIPTCNSWFLCRWLVIWLLEHWPGLRIIEASYSAKLITDHSRFVRREFRSNPHLTRKLQADSQRADQWNTVEGGGLLATTIGGQVSGFPGDVMLVDDPYKGWKEAWSAAVRRDVRDWFDAELYTRRQSRTTIIVLHTRWHPADLTGYLLHKHPDDWQLIRLPALAEPDDPLGRAEGEALCPERAPREELLAGAGSEAIWRAVYQQDPRGLGTDQLYNHFAPQRNVNAALGWVDGLPLHMSWDFNLRPGMHVELGQYLPDRDLLTVVDELHGPGWDVRAALEAFATWFSDHGGAARFPEVHVFGDTSGKTRSMTVSQSSYDLIAAKLRGLAIPHRFRVPRSAPSVKDSVDDYNEALRDLRGQCHYQVHPRCRRLLADLAGVKPDEHGHPDKSDPDLTHASDAERYRVTRVRPISRRPIVSGGRVSV